MTWGARDPGPDLVRSSRDPRYHHPIYVSVCPARCPDQTDAGQPTGSQFGGILVGKRRWADVRVYPPPGRDFHNGAPVTAEDVQFSFQRYKGTSAREYKERVREVEIVDPHRVRFHLKEPWPDFMTFFGTPRRGPAGSSPKNMWSRWVTMASKSTRSVPGPISL